jgi:hypothetical protein
MVTQPFAHPVSSYEAPEPPARLMIPVRRDRCARMLA